MKKVIITGNVGHDASTQVMQDGSEFVKFSVGVSVGTKQNPKTDWCEVTCNGKLADVAKNYVRTGIKVLIEGFPTVNAYLSREGKAVGSLRIYANNIELLNRKENSETAPGNDEYILPEVNSRVPVGSLMNSDIPF